MATGNDILNEKGLSGYHYYYFIGIGGIGMSALARYFHQTGNNVMGYDRTPTALTDKLTAEGISVHFEDSIEHIPEVCTSENTVVIYTPAIPKEHVQFNYFLTNQYSVNKRSQILGAISRDRFTVAIAGTHGKTTTSTMVTHILSHAGLNCTAFLGGISLNLQSNLLIAKQPEKEIVVVEADEFDRSFLTLSPDIAVITSVEADHLDIYGSGDELKKSFLDFAQKLKDDGTLIIHEDHARGFDFTYKYALGSGDYFARNLRVEESHFVFDMVTPNKTFEGIPLYQPGFHNVENAMAAIVVAMELGVSDFDIREALRTYEGVKRRFEWKINEPELVFIDDYAHHPTEIKQFILSCRKLFPKRKLTVIFQPHLFSRTRDFADEFSKSLSLADHVVLLDIYPAREQPLPGVTSEMLLQNITTEKHLCSKDDLIDYISNQDLEILATLGAGDIDKLVDPIQQKLSVKYA